MIAIDLTIRQSLFPSRTYGYSFNITDNFKDDYFSVVGGSNFGVYALGSGGPICLSAKELFSEIEKRFGQKMAVYFGVIYCNRDSYLNLCDLLAVDFELTASKDDS